MSSEARRQGQCQADVARENEGRRSRNQEPETREGWNATQMVNHEALLPFSDTLTTLMLTVASDLSEAQRERLTGSLCLQGVEVTAQNFEAVRTVFVELFCTPKSSMENPSLRGNKSGIAEDFIEDELGQWAADEVTGEQGYIDDEGSCFRTWDNDEYAWRSRSFRTRKLKKKWRAERKGGDRGTRRTFLGEEAQDPESLPEEDGVWWSKRKRGKKGFSKGNESFRKGGFRTSPSEKGSNSDCNPHQGKNKD